MRFSIAAFPVRNAAAISFTPKPHRMFSMSATCATSGKLGMAAGEHHAQLVVPDRRVAERFGDDGGERPFALEEASELGRERARGALAPKDVERAMLRGRHQPCGRILRNAAQLPHLERAAERVLHHVLGEREVVDAEESRERGDHPSRFAPEEMVAWLRHYMLICMIGRTSTNPPLSKIGHPEASFAASLMSFA